MFLAASFTQSRMLGKDVRYGARLIDDIWGRTVERARDGWTQTSNFSRLDSVQKKSLASLEPSF
jgi:hypothetical protein